MLARSTADSATIEVDQMATLSDFEELLPTLSPGEKAQILKWIVQELGGAFPGIDSRPDVCGGERVSCGPGSPYGFSNRRDAWAPVSRNCSRRIPRYVRKTW